MPIHPIGSNLEPLKSAGHDFAGIEQNEAMHRESIGPKAAGKGTWGKPDSGFGDLLVNAVNEVNRTQAEADHQAQLVATGRADNPHAAVIAMEKADLALDMTVKVTEKIIAAYRQVSQMQL